MIFTFLVPLFAYKNYIIIATKIAIPSTIKNVVKIGFHPYVENMEAKTKLIGYARVSTDDQNLDRQIQELTAAGVPRENIFEEHGSGRYMSRKELNRAFRAVYEGDTLVVVSLDRLARSLKGLLDTLTYLDNLGGNLKILNMGIDTNTIGGRLVFQIIGAIAEFESAIIAERTRSGVAAKKAKGWKPGPRHSILSNEKRLARFRELVAQGLITLDKSEDQLTAQQVIDEMNKADPKAKKIKSPQTYRQWKYAGWPGYQEEEPPLDVLKK